jgi:hypothetical protein
VAREARPPAYSRSRFLPALRRQQQGGSSADERAHEQAGTEEADMLPID